MKKYVCILQTLFIKILDTLLSTLGHLLTPSLLRSRGMFHVNIMSNNCFNAFLECRTIKILGKHICVNFQTLDLFNVHHFGLLEFTQETLQVNMSCATTNTPVVCKIYCAFVVHFKKHRELHLETH